MKKLRWFIICLACALFPLPIHADTSVLSPSNSFEQQGATYDQWLKDAHFIGTALVVKQHHVLLYKGYGFQNKAAFIKNSIETHYEIGSIQKAFTAALIGQLIDQKQLSFTTKLATFYPQIPHSQEITIKEMLDMVSGLHLSKKPKHQESETALLDYYVAHTTFSHPKQFVYSPINYHLLAGIIQQLTHQSYWEALQKKLILPYHLTSISYFTNWLNEPQHSQSYKQTTFDPYGELIPFSTDTYEKELGTGNIDMTINDLYTFYTLLFQGQLLSPKTKTTMLAPLYKETYVGGQYNYLNYYRARGEIAQQQTLALFTPAMDNVVILMSNNREDDTQMSSISSIFSDMIHQTVQFK